MTVTVIIKTFKLDRSINKKIKVFTKNRINLFFRERRIRRRPPRGSVPGQVGRDPERSALAGMRHQGLDAALRIRAKGRRNERPD